MKNDYTIEGEAVLLRERLPEDLARGERRAVEQAQAKAMLEAYFGQAVSLSHHPNGSPFLAPELQRTISISHSDKDIVILLAPIGYRLGVDLEDRGEQVLRVATRLLSEEEEAVISGEDDRKLWLHLLWSAKESLYKAENTSESYFKVYQLRAIAWDKAQDNQVLMTFNYQGKTREVVGLVEDEAVLTYTLFKE